MQNWYVCGFGHPPYAPYQKRVDLGGFDPACLKYTARRENGVSAITRTSHCVSLVQVRVMALMYIIWTARQAVLPGADRRRHGYGAVDATAADTVRPSISDTTRCGGPSFCHRRCPTHTRSARGTILPAVGAGSRPPRTGGITRKHGHQPPSLKHPETS
jgi:hypothetical protein